jgi:hypothetical protein
VDPFIGQTSKPSHCIAGGAPAEPEELWLVHLKNKGSMDRLQLVEEQDEHNNRSSVSSDR